MEKKEQFYSLKNILEYDASYYMIIGERSNGKTYSVEDYGLKNYCDGKGQMAIVRRNLEDFRGKRGKSMFSALVKNGLVEKYSNGKWNDIYYYSAMWYLCKYDEKLDKRILDETPLCYAFALTSVEHDKSTSYPDVTTVLFDEFLSKSYVQDEFVMFMNTLSTIIRYRDNVKIFMCGNTINQHSPYFLEMGIKDIKTMEKGTIKEYSYGESGLKVVVEFSDNPQKKKKSDKYFAFDNPKLKMITQGKWEMSIYPHLPCKYNKKDILYTYFITFEDIILQCEIIQTEELYFTYIHRKTTPIKSENDLVFVNYDSMYPNYSVNFKNPRKQVEKKIVEFFKKGKVCYQDNQVGEFVRNFLETL